MSYEAVLDATRCSRHIRNHRRHEPDVLGGDLRTSSLLDVHWRFLKNPDPFARGQRKPSRAAFERLASMRRPTDNATGSERFATDRSSVACDDQFPGEQRELEAIGPMGGDYETGDFRSFARGDAASPTELSRRAEIAELMRRSMLRAESHRRRGAGGDAISTSRAQLLVEQASGHTSAMSELDNPTPTTAGGGDRDVALMSRGSHRQERDGDNHETPSPGAGTSATPVPPDRSDSPVIVWRSTPRVKVATDLPPGLKSVYAGDDPKKLTEGHNSQGRKKAPWSVSPERKSSVWDLQRGRPRKTKEDEKLGGEEGMSHTGLGVDHGFGEVFRFHKGERGTRPSNPKPKFGAWYIKPKEWRFASKRGETPTRARRRTSWDRPWRRNQSVSRTSNHTSKSSLMSRSSSTGPEQSRSSHKESCEKDFERRLRACNEEIPTKFIARAYKRYIVRECPSGARLPSYLNSTEELTVRKERGDGSTRVSATFEGGSESDSD